MTQNTLQSGGRWSRRCAIRTRNRNGWVPMDRLIVRGARQHNLKNVSCELPRNRLVVVTGPSGSGKSSLAFDTIYAEGQRRYVESLSAYARQFLEQLAKPDVDSIEGLSPAIAIEQRALAKSPRSTVGTVTEIADYLRLLFARVGMPHCPSCGKRIEAQTVQQIVDRILEPGRRRARSPCSRPIARGPQGRAQARARAAPPRRLRARAHRRAGRRPRRRDRPRSHAAARPRRRRRPHRREGRREGPPHRLGRARAQARRRPPARRSAAKAGEPIWMSERFACIDCGISLPPIEPRMFSFNGPHGACPACDGIGVAHARSTPSASSPMPTRTLREGAVLAWGRRGSLPLADRGRTRRRGRSASTPTCRGSELPEDDAAGDPLRRRARPAPTARKKAGAAYDGIVRAARTPHRRRRRGDRRRRRGRRRPTDLDDGAIGDDDLGRFVVTRTCDACGGRRLRPEALAVRLGDRNIAEVGTLPLAHAAHVPRESSLAPAERT